VKFYCEEAASVLEEVRSSPEGLSALEAERKYGCVEVCVKRTDAAALRVYEKVGFTDTGYVDPDAPDCLNLMYVFR
jgi:diamine N-acetyltransferase